MAYKKIKKICEVCGEEFLGTPIKKCCSKDCTRKLLSKIKSGVPLIKTCEYCGKEYEVKKEREKKTQKYCSKECAHNATRGVSLLERGFSQEEYEKHISRVIKRNKSHSGKTYEEIFGKEQTKKMINEKVKQMSGSNNNMSYESVMKRFNLKTFEEAKRKMPATGRTGESHPFFGKHHSVESKIKMINTFEKKKSLISSGKISYGYFDNIYFQGTWELKFIIDCIENNIPIKRYDLEPIYYEYEGKPHHYFPDFIINENKIIEIKGIDKNDKKTIYKMKIAQEKYGDRYKILYDVGQNQNADSFLRLIKNKFKDRLEIKYHSYKMEEIYV